MTSTACSHPAADNADDTLIKVPELWFDDGNLILQAENRIFRVYRGLLCARSSVFMDMFAFPPPEGGNCMMDGCPIVQTYDSAGDMIVFLKAVLDSEFFEPPPTHTQMSIVEGILRLSTKYDVRHLRLRAMAHLLSTYPTTLEAWKARDTTRTIPSVENTPFLVLNLATEFDMPWLVPSVAYCISSHDINKTLDGAEWVGQSGASSESGASSVGSSGGDGSGSGEDKSPEKGLLKLGWANQKMCIKGRNNILLKQNAQALAIAKGFKPPTPAPGTPNGAGNNNTLPAGGTLPANGLPLNANNAANINAAANANGNTDDAEGSPPPPTCLTPPKCTTTRYHCADILTRWGTAGFLDFFDEQHSSFAPSFCEVCLEGFRTHCARATREMWDVLPEMFELPEWEELERLRELAME